MEPTTSAASHLPGSACTVYGAPSRIVSVDHDQVLVASNGESARRDRLHISQVEVAK